LIDAGPDLRTQLSQARVDTLTRAIFTHEHFDHIGGIAQFEYYVRLKSREPLPIYASQETAQAIEQQFAFMLDALDIHRVEPWQTLEFDGIAYTALPATHSAGALGFLLEPNAAPDASLLQESRIEPEGSDTQGSDTQGSDMQSSTKRLAYFPDTGPLSPEVLERLRDIDVLVIDATFNGNNWMPASHHSIDEAIILAQSLNAHQTYLTHLSMHYDEPITTAELEAYLAPYQGTVVAAFDGLVISI
jgi:phosphoribosyl 1,2-cyclic phosphate phosphodiesterase